MKQRVRANGYSNLILRKIRNIKLSCCIDHQKNTENDCQRYIDETADAHPF